MAAWLARAFKGVSWLSVDGMGKSQEHLPQKVLTEFRTFGETRSWHFLTVSFGLLVVNHRSAR